MRGFSRFAARLACMFCIWFICPNMKYASGIPQICFVRVSHKINNHGAAEARRHGEFFTTKNTRRHQISGIGVPPVREERSLHSTGETPVPPGITEVGVLKLLLTDSDWDIYDPAVNCWAIFKCPSGTKTYVSRWVWTRECLWQRLCTANVWVLLFLREFCRTDCQSVRTK